jgi:hypothetical protein
LKIVCASGVGAVYKPTAYSGHLISFPHDAPAEFIKSYPRMDMSTQLRVMLVGPKKEYERIKSQIKSDYHVDPNGVWYCLNRLKAVNSRCKDYYITPFDEKIVHDQVNGLFDDIVFDDSAVLAKIEQKTSDDVARVRESEQPVNQIHNVYIGPISGSNVSTAMATLIKKLVPEDPYLTPPTEPRLSQEAK